MNSFAALVTENDLQSLVPISVRQIKMLRRSGQIPAIRVNRKTFLYSPERVLSALEKLEVKTK
jgi:hypothetical protein